MSQVSMRSAQWEISATLPVRYEVVESVGLLDPQNQSLLRRLDNAASNAPRVVVVDDAIARFYGDQIKAYFEANRVEINLFVLNGSEQHKGMDQVLDVLSALNAAGTQRVSNPPIAIGGGVMLDVVGLAASLYRRGIPYVRVPTTLLGQVDVSVAAKTGVNFEGYRNRLGSYSPPPRTLIDRKFLETVPERQLRNGMGEILKMSLIKDLMLFELLEEHGADLIDQRFQRPGVADEVIRRSIQGMVEELEPNLWERNLIRAVDYGHSFSPLVEMRALPELLHGEAVALDCIFSAVLALRRGFLSRSDVDRVIRVARRLGLPVWHPSFGDVDLLWAALSDTVRHRDGAQNLPVMSRIGAARFLNDVTPGELAEVASVMLQCVDDSQERGASAESHA
ncbi:3-dehydroquinate synthase [Micromonospora haikouensis]|uniref:2-epi-5-epi-valiolone synthase n=1 Tax=Micromonospora haikouensis TaxID=686309 RepID=A0A1C4XXS6_9ACTN|nr:sedoheptulose 7-phosphate cyclase [Micromonospora haikouensis]SCF13299.1 3-dehydroquinate synthase [Micromonospora haikouensis]